MKVINLQNLQIRNNELDEILNKNKYISNLINIQDIEINNNENKITNNTFQKI